MQIFDKPNEILTPIIPAGESLVIKRCSGATINLHGQVITGGVDIRDSPGIKVTANGANPARVTGTPGSGKPCVIVYASPGAVMQFLHSFGHPDLVSNPTGYLSWTPEDWLLMGGGFTDYDGGVTWNRCRIFGAQIGITVKTDGAALYCLVQGVWGDGMRALGSQLRIVGNRIYDLFDASNLHPDLIQSYQDKGATVPWDDITITDNDLNARYTTDSSVTPRSTAQGIFFGRGPYGDDILIARNKINCHAYRAISVPDGAYIRIEDNSVSYQYPDDDRYPFIQNHASAGTVLRNVIPSVHADPVAIEVAGNVKLDGSPSRTQ